MKLQTNLLGLLSFLIVIHNAYSQETKFHLKESGRDKEEYYVLKDNPKVLHGSFVRYRTLFGGAIQVLETGEYKEGLKHGLWESFYDFGRAGLNDLKERGHYVNGKRNGLWTTYYRDTSLTESSIEKFNTKKRLDSVNLTIHNKGAKLKEAGMYLNDKRVGEWTVLNYNGDIVQKYNYTKRQITFELNSQDSTSLNQNRKLSFLGGETSLLYFLSTNFRPPLSINYKDSLDITAWIEIDEIGGLKSIRVDTKDSYKKIKEELIRVFELSRDNWIPAVKDGKGIKQSIGVCYRVRQIENLQNSKRWQIRFEIL